MSQKFRLPGINASTDKEKLEQVRSYLYQLANQLNFVMDNLPVAQTTARQEDDYVLFARIRPLIMQSKEVADAIREQLKNTFAQKEIVSTLANTVSQIADLHGKTLRAQKNGELLVDCDMPVENRLFLVAGWFSAQVVNTTVVLMPGGEFTQSGNLPFRADEDSRLHLPMTTGDRLLVISDREFSATIL